MSRIPGKATKSGFALVYGMVLVMAFATTTPRPWLLTILGTSLGSLSGYFRSRASAADAGESKVNAFAWLCAIGLLVLSMAIAENMFIGAWAASVAGYLLADALCWLVASHRNAERERDG